MSQKQYERKADIEDQFKTSMHWTAIALIICSALYLAVASLDLVPTLLELLIYVIPLVVGLWMGYSSYRKF